MKRVLGQAFLMGILATSSVALTPSCAENDQSIFIRGAMAPPQNRQNGACVYTADPTQPGLFEGVLDVGVRDSYVSVLLVGSQLIGRGDPSNTRAESNRAHINGAVVKVTEPDGAVIGEFTSLATGFADIQQNNTPGFGSVAVTTIDPPTATKIGASVTAGGPAKLVLAIVKAFGKTLGGVDLESGEYQLPIRVCNGCLVSFSSGHDPAVAGNPNLNCERPLDAQGGQGLPCQAGQDEVTPCQLCRGRPACDGR